MTTQPLATPAATPDTIVGWEPVPAAPGGHDGVQRCTADLCGAFVRVQDGDDRRKQHDREFHLLRAETGGPMDGYILHLDDKQIGYAYLKRTTYNLRRLIVDEQWVVDLTATRGVFSGGDRFRDAMNDATKASGAKAWGKGKNPKAWHYPETQR